MASFTKVPLTGSADGRGVKVAATASAGTLIHTADATALDEVWLWLYNGHTATVPATVQFGGTSTPDDDVKLTVPYKEGAILVVPGWVLTDGAVLRAYADVANVIVAYGYVNRVA